MEAPLSALETEITPTEHFFIRNHFDIPRLDVASWRLVVDGEVARPRSFSYAELSRFPGLERTVLLECAGNSRAGLYPRPAGVLWRHGAVGSARWSGVALRALLEECEPNHQARHVVLTGADHGEQSGVDGELDFAMSLPVDKAMDPDTLVATQMNGEPLAPSHGFPARAVVPGWYGMASVKWLTRIQVTAQPFQGFFRAREYAFIYENDDAASPKEPVTTLRVKSLVTWPGEGLRLPVGSHRLRGVAWSGHGRISRVEVSVDGSGVDARGGVWREAKLSPSDSAYSWTHWELPCQLDRAGFRVVRVRAFDEAGNAQPDRVRWNFRGVAINSIHSVPIEVVA